MKTLKSRSLRCSSVTNENLAMATGRMYAEENFGPKEKEHVSCMGPEWFWTFILRISSVLNIVIMRKQQQKLRTVIKPLNEGHKVKVTQVWQVWQVYLFYNQKIIDPCDTYIQSQVNTGINIGIIYNWLT